LRFLRFSFTQRTQCKRLRLNGNRASVGMAWLTGSTAIYDDHTISNVPDVSLIELVLNEPK